LIYSNCPTLGEGAALNHNNLRPPRAPTKMTEIMTASTPVLAARQPPAEPDGGANLERDEIIRWENENRSLQTSLDLVISENSRLCHRLAERSAAINDIHFQLEQTKTALQLAEVERGKVTAALNATNDKYETETTTLNGYLFFMFSRTVAAQELLANAQQSLLACINERDALASAVDEANERLETEARFFGVRLNTVSSRAEAAETAFVELRQALFEKLNRLQTLNEIKTQQVQELEQSRAELIDAASALLKTVTLRDKALAHTKEIIKSLIGWITKPQIVTTGTIQMRSTEALLSDTISF
jgi:hypothetical protein